MKNKQWLLILIIYISSLTTIYAQFGPIQIGNFPYEIYPGINDNKPDLPSPFIDCSGKEYVIAFTRERKYAIIPVSLSNDREICSQLVVDTTDFPVLAKTGLHSEKYLGQITTITGRSLDEINRLGKPEALSHSGFLAENEEIIPVIRADNRIVTKMGLTHPQMAKPLFHVLNMMDTDLKLNRWNMVKHKWENIKYFYYNGKKIFVEAEDTKGGQKSIFNDHIEGGFYIRLWRQFESEELTYLKKSYSHLSAEEFTELKNFLSIINTGEMQPQYIMRYGFYEGHTFWRTDPVAISFIFGLKSLDELHGTFNGKLYTMLTRHFTESRKSNLTQ
jgi:hypothetical protein